MTASEETTRTSPTVGVIGTLDTKSEEIRYVRDRLAEFGMGTLVIDSGILGEPGLTADVSRDDVCRAGGYTLAEVQGAGSRAEAVRRMQEGLAALVRSLRDTGRLDGVLCLGGAEGGLMGAAAMQALPVGVPKVIVSPSASGRREFGPFMGQSDIMVMHSVIDILGLNAVARSIFDNAAAAVAGMCTRAGTLPHSERPCVGVTMLGQTTPGAMVVVDDLEKAGYEPIVFHANGVGGPAMEAFIEDGLIAGVIDYTLSEVANTMFNGVHATSEKRMTAAVEHGLPLIVVPGAADFFNQGSIDTVPEEYYSRPLYHHNPVATLVRVLPEEMASLGRIIAARIENATAPTEVIIPQGGLSLIGIPSGPIASREADDELATALANSLPPTIPLRLLETDINSPEFAHFVAGRFIELMHRAGARPKRKAAPHTHDVTPLGRSASVPNGPDDLRVHGRN